MNSVSFRKLPLSTFLAEKLLTKRSNIVSGITPEHVALNEDVKAQALRTILNMGLAGAGTGAGAAGIIGLYKLLTKREPPQAEFGLSPKELEVNYPQFPEEEKKPKAKRLLKHADWANTLVKNVIPTPVGEKDPLVFSPSWLRGDSQVDKMSLPWFYPGLAVAGVGGLYGGHQLIKWLLKKHRKAVDKAEIDQAKKEFDEAMMGSYNPEKTYKISSYQRLNKLDYLYDTFEKKGLFDWLPSGDQIVGRGLGSYAAMASLLGGFTGLGMYRWLKSREKSKLLEDMLNERIKLRSMYNPPEINVIPTPRKREIKSKDEEEEKLETSY